MSEHEGHFLHSVGCFLTHTSAHTHAPFVVCLFILSVVIVSFRESLCSVLLALEKHLGEIASAGEQLIGLQEKIVKVDREANILKEAVNTPSHPLITMQDRLEWEDEKGVITALIA